MKISKWFGGLLISATVVAFGQQAAAESSLDHGMGAISFRVADEDFLIAGRFFPANQFAIIAEAGIRAVSNEESGADYRLGAEVRKYIMVDRNLAPFLGAGFSFFSDYIEATDENEDGVALDAHFGAEYFLAERFSVEAAAGVAFETITDGEDHTVFGTARTSLGANFYFP